MNLSIHPGKIVRFLIYCEVFLIIMNLFAIFARFQYGASRKRSWVKQFYVDQEYNIPTTFTVLLFLICTALFLIISFAKKQNSKSYFYWLGLSLIFLFLGMDELYEIHELLAEPLRNMIVLPSYLFFAWVIPYALATLLIGILYLRFFIRLDKRFKILFFTAGAIYLTGAVGIEMLGAHEAKVNFTGTKSLTFALLSTVEEGLEMLGLIVMIHALLQYIFDRSDTLVTSLTKPDH